MTVFRRLGYTEDKVKLVLNRYRRRDNLDAGSIADALGASICGTVANDFPTVIKAMNEGKLLAKTAPRARVTKDIQALLKQGGLFGG